MPRTFRCALVLLLASTSAHAQDAPTSAPAEDPAEAAPAAEVERTDAEPDAEVDDTAAAETSAAETSADDTAADDETRADDTAADDAESASRQPPKIAVIVSGDPDPSLQSAARRVERALEGQLRAPFDPGLRAALRGEPGDDDDGLEAVRRERRRLGFEERHDAPILATLGRRAGASAVAVVRAGDGGPELLVLDVANGAFYEGTLPLLGQPSRERVAQFVARRARISARGARITAPAAAAAPSAPAAATAPDTPEQSDEDPGFFEQFWPYLVAGLLLAGMVTAIAITSATAGSEQPVLRFVPGGR